MTFKIEKVFSYEEMKKYSNSIINAADFRADCPDGVRLFYDYQPGFDQAILTKTVDGAVLLVKTAIFDIDKLLQNEAAVGKLEKFLEDKSLGRKFLVDCLPEKAGINVICDAETGEAFVKTMSFPPRLGDKVGGEITDSRSKIGAWGGKKFIYFHLTNYWANIAYAVALSQLFMKPSPGRLANDKLLLDTIAKYIGLPISMVGEDVTGLCRPKSELGLPLELMSKLEVILKNTTITVPKDDLKGGYTCSDFLAGRVPAEFQGELQIDIPIGKVYKIEAVCGGKSVRVYTKDARDTAQIEEVFPPDGLVIISIPPGKDDVIEDDEENFPYSVWQ